MQEKEKEYSKSYGSTSNQHGKLNVGIQSSSSSLSNNNNPLSNNNTTSTTDQERKILLLMLLAQVCALHDSTPKTFIVHVLSLYERGILDYDSIAFLFDLGLVPAIEIIRHTHTHLVSSSGIDETTNDVQDVNITLETHTDKESSVVVGGVIVPYRANTTNIEHDSDVLKIPDDSKSKSLLHQDVSCSRPPILTTTSSSTTTTTNTYPTIPLRADSFTQYDDDNNNNNTNEVYLSQKRLQEVSLIREHLTRQESQNSSHKSYKSNHNNNKNILTQFEHSKQQQDSSSSTPFIPSWTVEHHPLSFSRYLRDFYPQAILASGAFGQVFQATNKLDGVDYAIKKVIFSAKGYDTQQVDLVIREVQCKLYCILLL